MGTVQRPEGLIGCAHEASSLGLGVPKGTPLHSGVIMAKNKSTATRTVAPLTPVTILRLPAVLSRVGKCRSGLYAEIEAGRFPKPIKLSDRAVGWLESEVAQWLLDRVAARDEGATK